MYSIYKLILPITLLLLSFSSCQKDNSEEIKILNSFLYENYTINANVLKDQQEEYHTKVLEKPRTRIKKLDTINETYNQLISKISNAIVTESPEVDSLKKQYNQLLDEIGEFVKSDESYTIDRFLMNNKDFQLDSKYHLNVLRNNLVIAMSYAFEHSNKPLGIKSNVKSLKHLDTRVSQNEYRTLVTLSSAIAQTSPKNRYVLIDKIVLNGSDTNLEYMVVDNYSFATITLDSLKHGNYFVQGKLKFLEDKRELMVQFSREFQIK